LNTSSNVVSIIPRKEKPKRAELSVLDSYISHISLWSSQSTQNDSIGFENAQVAVSPWVAKLIHRFCNSDAAPGTTEVLVTQSVALIAKCRTDMVSEVADAGNLTDVYTRQAEMMLNVAVGTVVVRELQEKCNELLAKGSNDDAKELNQLQHETRNVVQNVRNLLNHGEKQRASQLASTFLPADSPQPSKPTVPSAPVPLSVPVPPAPRKPPTSVKQAPLIVHSTEPKPQPRKLGKWLFAVVATAALVAAAIYGVGLQRPEPVQGDVSESLMSLMSKMSGITNVQDRNPYVVLTVHADFWSEASDSRRSDWIEDLSRLSERHGYTGLLIRSSGGAPLAEWVRGRGVQYAGAS